ncbi:MtrAB system accessory lipoprotein LpqB [Corynebacterium suicordis]|uniref:Lipoprotein LpqB n=1 Tax=Corynebacterium suicordis DSM 45110 TaxID=1121369 RepID=A0ABR9ZIK2_9CORY|nr:MtrAB system accessory lipoprotein LpqB [Corynebacterium suicordis]MBF4553034.1 MtrAB system accessory protein LpqB [Corynebacterium suicordis DSM 45110]MDR6278004.1 hypothetical protein [Corynebacterium suicordis]
MNHGRRKHFLAVTAAVSSATLLAGCTTLPGESSPGVVSSYSNTPAMKEVPEPTPDNPSDLMLRDFFSASAHPLSNHEAARKFLTADANKNWQAKNELFILDNMEIASEGVSGEDKITYKVRGNLIGSVGVGGTYTPLFTGYETTYDLQRENGQWRVSNLPGAVIVDRADFTTAYQPRTIYFSDLAGQTLVPDRRWIYTQQQSLGASLVSLFVEGPREGLSGAVRSLLPDNATAQTHDLDGRGISVEFAGITGLKPAERELLAAQVVWMLAAAEVRGPYRIMADGVPLSESVGENWGVDDVSRFDPRAEAQTPLRAIIDGNVVNLSDDSGAEPINGWINAQYNESASYAPRGDLFALVTGRGDERRTLLMGEANGSPHKALDANTLTRPAWSANAESLYVVADGRQLVRMDLRPDNSAERVDVNMDEVKELEDDSARISVFRVSRDGARAVLLINGSVYIAVLKVNEDGRPALGPLAQVGHQIGDTAISADWAPEGGLLVGTRAPDSPLWSVAVDGSSASSIPARNLSAPVVAVAANSTHMYATDARALMQLDNSTSDMDFWREVPPVRGQRAAPILTQ